MARKLRVYQTSLGFYDLAIAAPSMKAALEAWGAESNLFHQGVARESDDPDIVAAAMSKPGVILRRPVGSSGPFKEHAELPSHLSGDKLDHRPKRPRAKSKQPACTIDDKSARNAAVAFEREQRRRESERRRDEAAREKERQRRQQAIAKAQGALDKAKQEHDRRTATIEAERAEIEKRWQEEEARWEKQREKLETALHRARD
jgi:colicin import membrane protein